MPITMEPREGGRILYIRFVDPWTLSDFVHIMEKDQAYRDRARGTIHSIVDCSQTSSIPRGMLNAARHSPAFVHRTKGYIVAVGTSENIQTMGHLFAQVLRINELEFFQTEKEGMAYLRKIIANEGCSPPGTISLKTP